jgi:tetrapyrrole methylase family protein/MazG family protein
MEIGREELGRAIAALGGQFLQESLQVATTEALARQNYPHLDPAQPALLLGLEDPSTAQRLCAVLSWAYPSHWSLIVLDDGIQRTIRLADLPSAIPAPGQDGENEGRRVDILIPPLPAASSLQSLQDVIARLRGPGGCPWDQALTWAKLRSTLLEETYELLAALDADDAEKVVEEQGDLLVQLVMQTQIAAEEARFRMPEVIRRIVEKLVRRHPHVFGDAIVSGTGEVLQNWEAIKREEREQAGAARSPLAGVPADLPALALADAYLERMSRLREDHRTEPPCARLAGLASGEPVTDVAVGEALFELVAWARDHGVDAESALRDVNARFASRVAAEGHG